jgi:hypothetical protein
VNHFARLLDALGWDATAMSVAQREAGCFSKLSRICGFDDAKCNLPHFSVSFFGH